MKERKFLYSGPNSAVTIAVKDASGATVSRDVMLWKGREVSLPEEHDYTRQLLALKLITPVDPPPTAAAPAPALAPAPKKTQAASTTISE